MAKNLPVMTQSRAAVAQNLELARVNLGRMAADLASRVGRPGQKEAHLEEDSGSAGWEDNSDENYPDVEERWGDSD
jgi:hypothetical protein